MGTGSGTEHEGHPNCTSEANPSGETAMHKTSIVLPQSLTLPSGVAIPDSTMAREVTELVRDTENSLLFNHSSRVYYFCSVIRGSQWKG
jgi:hypothetical protein